MATWITLTQATGKQEPIAVNLDRAVSMHRVVDKTRIELEGDKSLDVVEPIPAILDLAGAAGRAIPQTEQT